MMTNLLKKIFISESLFDNEIEKDFFGKIKKDIAYLKGYTLAYSEYKFLLDIKRHLIPANRVTERDISPFDKWKLILLYREEGGEKRISEYFSQSNITLCYSDYDNSMLMDSCLHLKNFLKDKVEPRFSTIFPENRMQEIEESIIKYFLYKKQKLKLVNEETFFEDYFDKSNFIEPLEKYFSNVLGGKTESKEKLMGIWLYYFVVPRTYLFSQHHNTKKVTGYSTNPIFTGKIEYNYFELKNKIEEINNVLDKELSDLFSSHWLKSKVLDLLCVNQRIKIDISSEPKNPN